MAADRTKPLSPPVTITEEYLAALLGEIRDLADRVQVLVNQRTPPTPDDGTIPLKEPKRGKGRVS